MLTFYDFPAEHWKHIRTTRTSICAPCGLPLAFGWRRVRRLCYRRGARVAGIGLSGVTVAASLVARLLGPVATAVYAAALSVPVWLAWW